MSDYFAEKRACAELPYTFEWGDLYTKLGLTSAANPITLSDWTIQSGTSGAEYVTGDETTITLSGGSPGDVIIATNNIEINNGQHKDCATLYVRVF